MTDVFISYKRRLRPVVERLAAALRELKVAVWFDARLEPGEHFSDEIAREVRAASCVLVCWSNDAFPHGGDTNAWVRGEATIGQERKVLVSVQIEPTSFDPPWNMMHHEDLIGWAGPDGLGNPRDPRWLNVLEAIGRKIGRPGLSAYVSARAVGDEALNDWRTRYPGDPLADAAEDEGAVPVVPVLPPGEAARRRPGALWIALGAVVLLALGAAAFFLTNRGEPAPVVPPPVSAPQASAPPPASMPPQTSAFKTAMLGYCRETPDTLVFDCACTADILERELDDTAEAIFLIIAKPGATADAAAVNRLLLDAGYSQADIEATGAAVTRAMAKVEAECARVEGR